MPCYLISCGLCRKKTVNNAIVVSDIQKNKKSCLACSVPHITSSSCRPIGIRSLGILVPANLLLCALETEWKCFAPFHWFLTTTKATILLLQHVSNGNMHSTCQRSQKDIRHGLSNTQDIHTKGAGTGWNPLLVHRYAREMKC